MNVREATSEDGGAIRRVADASLDATYSETLGEDIVAKAAEEWYATDRLQDRLADDSVLYLVATVDDEVVAFSESEFDGDAVGVVQWLHVAPAYRDRGFGERLLEHTETELLKNANRIESRVLAANEAGNAFYQANSYVRTGERSLAVGDESYTEHLYVKLPEGEPAAELTEQRDVADGTVYVAFDERERGSKAPLYVAYRNEDRTDKYGFYCGNCGSTETSMDAMGHIECTNCGNKRRATRWDSGYL
jgi:ribosomal protein S18 acetylase RimI-like enzyme/DNA-directed RNA polymerase subunit RPC12/RpoP